jgi:23S rRNA (uracil1939-C5)-methyltransferase
MMLGPAKGVTEKFAIGYRKLRSHELLPVRECPISSPLINRAIAAVWGLATEFELPKGLAEVEFFADDRDEKLLLEFLIDGAAEPKSLKQFAERLQEKLPQIAGVASLPRPHFEKESIAAPELDERTAAMATVLAGDGHLKYKVGPHGYRVSAGSFFQANRHLTSTLVELACGGAEGKLAMDLYAGAGLFTLPLAQKFERAIAVEAAPASFSDLVANAPAHVKSLQLTTEAFLARAPKRPDFVVVDPPRAGLGKRVVEGLVRLAPKSLACVSCDPSTLARDLPPLIAAGYRIAQAHLVDLFPQTFHIETVVRMER